MRVTLLDDTRQEHTHTHTHVYTTTQTPTLTQMCIANIQESIDWEAIFKTDRVRQEAALDSYHSTFETKTRTLRKISELVQYEEASAKQLLTIDVARRKLFDDIATVEKDTKKAERLRDTLTTQVADTRQKHMHAKHHARGKFKV